MLENNIVSPKKDCRKMIFNLRQSLHLIIMIISNQRSGFLQQLF